MTTPRQDWPADLARRYRGAGYWRGETLGDMLRDRATRHPGRTAVICGPRSWSYAELLSRAESTAHGFMATGLRPGDRVIVQLPNMAEFITATFGLFLMGALPVFALPAHRDTELAHFAAKSGATGLIIPDIHDGFDHRSLARALALPHTFVIGDLAEFAPLPDAPRGPDLPRPYPSQVAFLQISGGSTGLSKLIPRTHDDYGYSFRASATICGLTPESVYLAALPVAHNFPMSSPGIFGTLHAGATVVMCPNPAPDTAFPLIEAHRVTITGLVPPLALLWLQAAPRTQHDLSSLQVLQVGGARLLPEVAARIRPTLGCQLQQVFGMAEGLVNYTRLDDPEEIITTTQGRPISADDEILILDDNGHPVPDGTPGHLLTRGPYTIRAYHDDPAANARAFTPDGFYRTGDMVRRLPGGHLQVQGRATDHINRAGEKISAEEIEDHLLAHPAVFDAAVVSIPDTFLGERSCAFVITTDPALKPATLRAFVRARGIADFKVPDQVVFIPEFETTAVGKISRKALRAALRDKYLGSTA